MRKNRLKTKFRPLKPHNDSNVLSRLRLTYQRFQVALLTVISSRNVGCGQDKCFVWVVEWFTRAREPLNTRPLNPEKKMNKRIYRVAGFLISLMLLSGGCATTSGTRIDNIPMYGQPQIERPDFLKKADGDFIKQATEGFGSREAASKAWHAQAEKFMREGNIDYAMRRYNQSWLLNPNNYQPYWGFARIVAEQGKLDDAIAYLEKAKRLCDDNYQKVALLADAASIYSYKADSLPKELRDERVRYFALADQNFLESTGLDPTYSDSWLRWSHSKFREGKYTGAWERLKKARSLGAKEAPIYLKALEEKMPEPK